MTEDFVSGYAQAWSAVQLGQKFVNSIIATVGTLILTLPLLLHGWPASWSHRIRHRLIDYMLPSVRDAPEIATLVTEDHPQPFWIEPARSQGRGRNHRRGRGNRQRRG